VPPIRTTFTLAAATLLAGSALAAGQMHTHGPNHGPPPGPQQAGTPHTPQNAQQNEPTQRPQGDSTQSQRGPGTLGAPADAAGGTQAGAPAAQQAGRRPRREFRVSCGYVKSGMFDPIVFAGQEMAGHTHQFFGATSINPNSTPAALVTANASGTATTCVNTADGSAYWVPALLADGQELTPDRLRATYRAPRGMRVRPFPRGFAAIAGTPRATAPQAMAGYRCEFDAPGTPPEGSVPECDAGERVMGVITFANCWDGTNVSAPTQPVQSHIAYRDAATGACPSTHPVAVPELQLEVFWPTDGSAAAYALASGDVVGLHADFMNGWKPGALRRQVQRWSPPRRF